MFSVKTILTVGLAAVAPLASAWVQPKSGPPEGNPVAKPNSGDIIPAGSTYNVIWNATSPGPITILFLKGPSSNAVPQYAIVEHLANTGSYQWHVAADTAASDASTPAQGYGLQLIDETTKQYQYTTQFGISKSSGPPSPAPGYPSTSHSHETSTSSSKTAPPTAPTYAPVPAPANKPYPSGNSTAPAPSTGSGAPAPYSAPAPSTSAPAPSTAAPAPATSSRPATNAAGQMTVSSIAGLVVAAGVAVLAF